MNRKENSYFISFFSFCSFMVVAAFLIVAIIPAGQLLANQKADTEEKPLSLEEEQRILKEIFKGDGEIFSYNSIGRPDPFRPFITEELLRAQKEDAREVLTGMRKFEPGQLSLVAIAFEEGKPLAMVQDSLGKGYVIKKGTKIGRSSVVDDIIPNKVIIKELAYTMTQKKIFKTTEMVLKKEGDR